MEDVQIGLDWRGELETGRKEKEKEEVGETEGRTGDTTDFLFFRWYIEGRLEVLKIAFPGFYGYHFGKRAHVT